MLNRLNPLLYTVQSTESRTTYDWSILLITVLLEDLMKLHLNELKHLLIVNHITLVQENNQARNVYLTCKKYVLTCLCDFDKNTWAVKSDRQNGTHLPGTRQVRNGTIV